MKNENQISKNEKEKENEPLIKNTDNLKPKLNSNFAKYINNINLLGEDKIKFISVDQKINYIINSSIKTKFYELEAQLYEQYPEYKEYDNFFIFNGNKINRWRTLRNN